MPVRDRAIERILRLRHKVSYNNLHLTVRVDDVVMERPVFEERYWNPVDEAYEAVVDSLDWNRLLLEASARHIELDHDLEGDYGYVCPECITEALLADETFYSWQRHPSVKRRRYAKS